ncbi:PREDICTED: sodium channel subunit beta-4 [Nanorana parkeri]|uniref:sodium channel subunit beta-4 n=1 Tax=Nanorana parkeri TaxID=125878 RepID=UPI000853F7D8|nr:PREDICTED: sodium channel subunit beta-4 [Nanorana parkeri]
MLVGPPGLGDLSSHSRGPLCHRHSWLFIVILATLLAHTCFTLEVSVGKNPHFKARNGTDVSLLCWFTTCIGFEDVTFRWEYRFNESSKPEELVKGTLKNKKSTPKIIEIEDKSYRQSRVTLLPSDSTKEYNLTLVLSEVEFDDAGRYTCIVKNKKEKDTQSNATIFLTVVDKFEVVDNTLTLIIVSVVGGVIGLLILILIIKKTITFIIKRNSDKKKDCLVSSSVNDNTDNASKPEKPKA